MSTRFSIPRMVGAIVATGLIVCAAYFAIEYRRADREFFTWIDARPMAVAVDLSRPGLVSAPFHQTCQIAHGESIYLDVQPAPDRSNAQPLPDLKGTVTIRDMAGNEVQSIEMAPWVDWDPNTQDPILLARFHSFAKGDYTATINVSTGAPELSGLQQTIYANYLLCGMERLPTVIYGWLAIACGGIGLVVGAFVVRGFVKYGFSARQGVLPHT